MCLPRSWLSLWSLLVLLAVDITVADQDNDWIDPYDMINFDHASGKMTGKNKLSKQEPPKGESKPPLASFSGSSVPDQHTDDSHKGRPDTNIRVDQQPPSNGHQPTEKPAEARDGVPKQKLSDNSSVYKTIFRKHVRMLLDKWDSQAYSGDPAIRLTLSLSASDVDLLRMFADEGQGDIYDVEEVLGRMVVQVESTVPLSYGENLLETYVGISLPTVIQILSVLALVSVILWIEMTLQICWRQKIIKLIFLAFFISIPWTWYHMYKQEEAKRQTELMRDVPDVCVKRHLSWYEMAVEVARSTFSLSEDQCVKYYEQMLVDPVWKVAPTEAIAVTFVRFFVSPAKHVGQALSEFVKAVFQNLPVTLWPIVLVCGMVILGLVLLLSFGYSIRLPFLLSIESSYAHSSKQHQQIMEAQHSQQQKQIEELRDQLKLVEGDRLRLMQSGATPLHSTHSEPSVRNISISRSISARMSASDQSVQGQGMVGMPMLTQGVQSVGIPIHQQGVLTHAAQGQTMMQPIKRQQDIRKEEKQNCISLSGDLPVNVPGPFESPMVLETLKDTTILLSTDSSQGSRLDAVSGQNGPEQPMPLKYKVPNDPNNLNQSHADLSKKLVHLNIQDDQDQVQSAAAMDCSKVKIQDNSVKNGLPSDSSKMGCSNSSNGPSHDIPNAERVMVESNAVKVEEIGVEGLTSGQTDLHGLTSPARQM